MYDYLVPRGYGDTFFQYAFNADALTNGQNYQRLAINIDNYDFIARHWAGWETVVDPTTGQVQAYDDIVREYAAKPMTLGNFPQGAVLAPEKRYRVNSRIQFDLTNVLKKATASTTAAQLVWSGARRIPGIAGDPAPAPGNYKHEAWAYPYSLTVQATPVAPFSVEIPITDLDFELMRVEMSPYSSPSKFSITLIDSVGYFRSNIPINANRFFHFNPALSHGELNFWPCPPILYKVNSSIKFQITSLINAGAGPSTFNLLFTGCRRVPCQ